MHAGRRAAAQMLHVPLPGEPPVSGRASLLHRTVALRDQYCTSCGVGGVGGEEVMRETEGVEGARDEGRCEEDGEEEEVEMRESRGERLERRRGCVCVWGGVG